MVSVHCTSKLLVKENQHVLLSGMKHISEEQRIMCGKLVRVKNINNSYGYFGDWQ